MPSQADNAAYLHKRPAGADGMGELPSGSTACRDTLKSAQILDVCCGGRMWWWEKDHPLAV